MLNKTPYSSQDEISLQLDLINHMWDKSPYLEFGPRQSESCRQHLRCIADIRVGARDEERIDVYPSEQPNSPIVVFIHGGWWRGGTRKEYGFVANGFVRRGYTVIISDYTLCPKGSIPDITQASRAAVIWAHEHAAEINGDPERIFVTGHSAGGQQAAMMAVTPWPDYGAPMNLVKGVVPISGIFDMSVFQSSWIQGSLHLNGDSVRSESPLFLIKDQMPPLLVMLGEEESTEFHRQSLDFVAQLRHQKHPVEYYDVEDEDHSTLLYLLGDPDSKACAAISAFFENCIIHSRIG